MTLEAKFHQISLYDLSVRFHAARSIEFVRLKETDLPTDEPVPYVPALHDFETGIPYAHAYRCPDCDTELYGHYRPFCGACGNRWPPAAEMVRQNRVTYADTYGKRSTKDVAEINAHLAIHSGKEIALWWYSVSHGNLELRLRHTGKPGENTDEPWLNTVIRCSMTSQIVVPQLRWTSNSQVQPIGDREIKFFDEAAAVEIVCSRVSLTFDVAPGL